MKVAIVTGGSGGIGRCTALALARAGCRVFEFSRHEKPAEGLEHITADVTDEAAVKAAVDEVMARAGRIDILVCNAGFGISGAAELTSSADAHAQLELNLFGMDNSVKAVLPHMRATGGGRIVCMSSIAGILPIPFQLWYSVSKAAIDAYVLALQNEVRPFNISVCAVLPGDIKSGFTGARRKTMEAGAYGERVARSVAKMEHDEETGMSPRRRCRQGRPYAPLFTPEGPGAPVQGRRPARKVPASPDLKLYRGEDVFEMKASL